MSNPTPGPHSVVQDGQGYPHIVSRWAPDSTTEARWTFLAKVNTPDVGTVLYKDGVEHTVARGEDLANAKLFASASRMKDLLEYILDTVDCGDNYSNKDFYGGHHEMARGLLQSISE